MVKSTALQCPSFSCVVWRAVAVSSKTFHESQHFYSHTFWQSRTKTSRRLCSSWISTESAQPLNLFSVWARNRTAGTSLCRTVSYLPLASGRVFVLILIVWLFNWPGCHVRAHFKFSVTIRWKFWPPVNRLPQKQKLSCWAWSIGHSYELVQNPVQKWSSLKPSVCRVGNGGSCLSWWQQFVALDRLKKSRDFEPLSFESVQQNGWT